MSVRSILLLSVLTVLTIFLAGGQARAGVLYDQVDTTSPESTTSQDFETMFDSFDSTVADDFTVPPGRTWRVESILFRGRAELPANLPSGMRVILYANTSNSPGTEISTQVASITPGTYPRPEAVLTDKQVLSPGTYWVGTQAILNAGNFSGPQWFWADSDAGPFGNAAYYKNPGGGFDSACAAFAIRSTCLFPDSFHPSHDQSFSVSGTDFSVVPDTQITEGPAEGSTITTNSPNFAFSSAEPGATFSCSLDGAAFAACSSPKGIVGLTNGSHSFSVKVTNDLGTADPTPATRSFTVAVPTGPNAACTAAKAKLAKANKTLKAAKKKLSKAKGKARKRAAKAVKKAKGAVKTANAAVKSKC